MICFMSNMIHRNGSELRLAPEEQGEPEGGREGL